MSTILVIPCYNEANRLDPAHIATFLELCDASVLLVDDGSSDGTGALLERLATDEPRVRVLTLTRNGGKAEAVRLGMRAALDAGATHTGYADADFATPPAELARLARYATDTGRSVVIGSRVALLGHQIERSAVRHYTGRAFATFTSLVLGFAVYDTQCGAKFFAATPDLHDALADPFIGRWSFDVELLGRLATEHGTDGFVEVPLREWRDVAGSKLSLTASARSTLELLAVRRALRRYRRALGLRDK